MEQSHRPGPSRGALVSGLSRGAVEPDGFVGGGAFGGNPVQVTYATPELRGRHVLARGRAGEARDVLVHEGTAVIIRARAEATLRVPPRHLHPRDLYVLHAAAQH